MYGFAPVAAIIVICYALGLVVKAINDIDDKWIPVICASFGGILGAVAFITGMPSLQADDILAAIAIGIVSGLSSVGINQIGKQMTKPEIDVTDFYPDEEE